jgi:2-hydroxychromene-2-carboxylate isomerase
VIDFWFEFASPYSYLAAARIGEVARGVTVRWRPFLLGPIFADRGWANSPWVLYPDKGEHNWRDVAREAEHHRIPFRRPAHFPPNSVLAARVALVGVHEGFVEAFAKAAYAAAFVAGEDLADVAVIDRVLHGIGQDGEAVRSRIAKEELRAQVDEARRLGIFGAPTFLVGDEMFWGNDRLERAVEWAKR